MSTCLCLQLLKADEKSISDANENEKIPEICEECVLNNSEDAIQKKAEEPILSQNAELKQDNESVNEMHLRTEECVLGKDEEMKFDKHSILIKKNTETTCGKTPRPYYVTLRHIEGNGVGYNQGYTSLVGFFALLIPIPGFLFWMFAIISLTMENLLLNAGLGLRYLATSYLGHQWVL